MTKKPQISVAQPSVMSLLLQMSFDGQSLSSGTGFVCESRVGPCLITNWHNLTGCNAETGQPFSATGGIPNEVTILHNVRGRLGRWAPVTEPLYEGATPLWVEHPTLGSRGDLVALPLTKLDDVQLYAYDLEGPGHDIAVGPTSVVSVVGFPFGEAAGGSLAIWATGFIASETDVDYNKLPLFFIDCRSRPGQSGSPVIAYRELGQTVALQDGGTVVYDQAVWRLLGIYSGRVNEQSDLGLVWKTSAIRDLVASVS